MSGCIAPSASRRDEERLLWNDAIAAIERGPPRSRSRSLVDGALGPVARQCASTRPARRSRGRGTPPGSSRARRRRCGGDCRLTRSGRGHRRPRSPRLAPRGARSGWASRWRGVKPSATSHGMDCWSSRWTPRRRSASSMVTRLTASPGRARATRPADAVDVVLGVPRELVVDDVRQGVDVQAAGGHVGRHEAPDLAVLERFERLRPVRLRAIGVDRRRGDAVAVQPRRRAVRPRAWSA